ncbi:cation diffusion facilitator family transporter [Microbacterium sp. NPDC006705]|uniref:Cation diffusion facilitator family transporter n=1 Tax=Microbacterium thalli TaxID=3027921 RepID=A0ABT5SP82_9MICO|nr:MULTISPECIES: cation diffusion facilitator family transporter [Microbacterium]MBP2420812.1 cobalt-zinc-cadmium efflux system protein [Microbacterium imperiale]MCZ4069142.1 cation diffusion facilitator family transporter [Microbacterium sp. H37-C3]MDD7928070.1 cation diffusion facilitator family transporter [Microbacterium thalli]MDD7963603.1 cation diffusion facilitator family transporter [Microbacterium thalli]MDN8550033.1 cation diffusion facilitator family transporter [Microbacterium tha
MGAGHTHGPAPEAGQPGDHRRKLWIAFGITAVIVAAQAVGSVVTGSLALLTDTAHAITDASGLLVALIAATLMLRPANAKRTWGFRRIEVIAALGQAALLLVVGTYTAVEGVRRLFEPPEVPAAELLIFGIIGLTANIIAIVLLSSSRGVNFNMRAAFLEVLNDALGSLGVIVAAIVIATTGFLQADAIAGLLIAALIVPRAFKLLRETTSVLMEFTPPGLDLDDVRAHILELDHVKDIHDLHASTVATGLPTISAHVVVEDQCFTDGHAANVLLDVKKCVAEHFEVSVLHSTFQIETDHIQEEEQASVTHA